MTNEVSQKKPPILAIVAGVLVAAAAGVYFYFSPMLALNALKNAAQSGDKDKLSEMIDFPSLRESVKSQLLLAMQENMQKEKDNPFAAFGMAMGASIADGFISANITPEGIAKILKAKSDRDTEAKKADPKANVSTPRLKWINSKTAHISFVDDSAPEETTTLELKRVGLFSWQLKGMDFPDSQFKE